MVGIQCTRNSPSRKYWRHGENGTSPRHTAGGGGQVKRPHGLPSLALTLVTMMLVIPTWSPSPIRSYTVW